MGKFICSCFVFLNLVLVGCDSGGGGDSNYSSSSSVAVVTPGLGAGGTGGTAFITPPSGAATTVTSGVPYSFSATVSGVTGTGGFAATIDTLIGDVSIDGLSVCFEPCFDLTPVAFGVFTSNAVVIRGSVPSAFVGIGTVQITIIYAEEDLEIISTFVVNVVGVASTLSFNPVSPASITAGDPLSVTATGSPAGGTFSSTGANAGTTGGTFSAINPTSGVFTFTGSTATGTASVNITYIGPGAAPVTLPYTVNVSAVVLNPLLVCDTPCGGLADNAPTPFNLLVTGGPNSIADLNVFLDLTHTFPGDLDITLTSPTGTMVELTSDNGGTTDDLFATVTFDDEAVASIVTITAPGGVFQPEGALSGFDGENANGTWTLNVVDDAGGDVGTLRSWCLAFDGVAVVNPNANCTTLVPLLTCVTPNTTLADTATTNVFVTITGGPTAISDLNVLMNVTHTFPGDLDITLTSPAGTVIDLTSDNGGGTDHLYSSVTLDDGAATSVTTIAAANGTFQPEQLLSTFNGENANGVWTVAFTDDAGGDVGCVGTVCLAFDGVALVNPNNTCFPVTLTPLLSCSSPTTNLNDVSTANFTVTVAAGPTSIADLNVFLDITHTFPGDLDISLSSPTGTTIDLTSDNGASTDDLYSTVTLDDESATSVTLIAAAGGTFQPEVALSAFDGEDSNGVWTLTVTDDAGGDVGCLGSFCLVFDGVALVNPNTTCNNAGAGNPPFTVVSGSISLGFGSAQGSGFPPTILHSLTVPSSVLQVDDLRMQVEVTHSFISDVEVSLTSPNSTTALLVNNEGGLGANLRVILDDDATMSIATDFNGSGAGGFESFSPAPGSFTLFLGENPTGSWTITVTDIFNSVDNGVLNAWGLAFNNDKSTF